MTYSVYRIGGVLLGTFDTEADAQAFINDMQYYDVSLYIISE